MKIMRWNNEHSFSDLMNSFFENEMSAIAPRRYCYAPATNIVETDKEFKLELSAPGMNKEDFKLDVDNGMLTVLAEKEAQKEEDTKNYTRKEFVYGCFSRSFTLPKSIDSDKIKAEYKNGILNIELPKKEEEQAKAKREIVIS